MKASQDVLREGHRALRVLQAKIVRANMTQQELAAAGALDEEAPPEADQQTEFDWKLNSIETSFRYRTKAANWATSWLKRPRGRPSFR